jgi:2-haloalkanoic acid dehalogenase type II
MSKSPSHPDLTSFKALSFDCYGTLIDDEAGMIQDLNPLLSQLPSSHPYRANPLKAVARYNHFSKELMVSQPTLLYDTILVSAYKSLAAELGVPLPAADESQIQQVGSSTGSWRAFPDTVPALQKLRRHYKLIILSNVSNDNIRRTVGQQLAPAQIDAVYTAQDIGSYKPDVANFRYLFAHAREDFGVDAERGELLHVAVSLEYDHVPAKEVGLRSVWISRGEEEEEGKFRHRGLKDLTAAGKLGFEWTFRTLGEFADEVERQFAAKDAAGGKAGAV